MELLSKDEINHVIKQLGYTKPLKWSINNYSDTLMGYLGEHLKLTVEVESGTSNIELKFFIKCIPRDDVYKADYLKRTSFFCKEYAMLNSLFKHFSEGSQKWRPSLLLAREDLFIFEDVTQIGYKMPGNRNTFTLEQVTACVETIARFHAQCYIYEEKIRKQLGRPYRIWEDYSDYLQEPTKGQNWRNTGTNAVIAILKVFSKFKNDPHFVNIDDAITKLYEKALNSMQPHPVYRNVVIHRDLWTNNILFKEVYGKYHALFVDFQTVLYSSPMMDLSSFLYLNTTREFRDNYLQDMIDLYYEVLSRELQDSHIDINQIIDREALQKCYNESILFGITQAALILPITVMDTNMRDKLFNDSETALRINEVCRNEEVIGVAKIDEHYLRRVSELLDEIVERYICTNSS